MTGAVGTTKLHEDSERSRNGGRGAAGGRTGTTKYTKVYEKTQNLDGGAGNFPFGGKEAGKKGDGNHEKARRQRKVTKVRLGRGGW